MITNGMVNYEGGITPDSNDRVPFNTVATYMCNGGFSLVGESSRTCTADDSSNIGAFDGDEPSCVREFYIYI